MFLVKYSGPELSLGRFGTVRPGQELRLTPVETAGIRHDKRFKVRSEVVSTPEERRLEISEMGHSELLEMCKRAMREGRPIEVRGHYSKAQLIHAWISMERNETDQRRKRDAAAREAREAAEALAAMTAPRK